MSRPQRRRGDDVKSRASPETQERILEGALRALGRHGPRKLSMSDVSDSAGVSRGTLYRYFVSKEQLLEALATYERRRFETGLAKALANTSLPRVQAVVDFAFAYLRDHPALARMVESEPAFVLHYLGEQLPWLRRATLRSLRTELEASVPVVTKAATAEQVADVLMRLLVSHFVTPGANKAGDARATKAVVDAITGQYATARPRRRP